MNPSFVKIVKLAGEAVGEFRLIEAGDRILAGVSGGKDSLMLLHVLFALRKRAPVAFDIEAVTFDPGFPGFRTDRIVDYCRRQSWPHRVIPFPMAQVIEEKQWQDSPCVLCSRLRRGKLYGLAAELGCNKLALGHHLDDLLVSFLMSLCRGQGLTTMAPKVAAKNAPVTVIRPLALTPEALIVEAAAEFGFPQAGKCHFQAQLDADGDRAYFRRLLAQLAGDIPHLRTQMLHSLRKVELPHLLDPRYL